MPAALSEWMTGRRIRWGNAGRAAAIAAAVLAGLATLPALLGEDEPPPLPQDVGLAGVAPSPVPPAPVAAAPAAVEPARPGRRVGPGTKDRPRRAAGRRREGGKRGGREPRRSRREPAPSPVAHSPALPTATYVPAPAPPPPSRGEFRIED